MAEAEQALGAAGIDPATIPGLPPELMPSGAAASLQAPATMLVVPVGPSMQARIQYADPAGRRIDIVVSRKRTAEELMRKTFGDGRIDESIDLSAFGATLDELALVIVDASDRVVANPVLLPDLDQRPDLQ
jgi:hypothetical protein